MGGMEIFLLLYFWLNPHISLTPDPPLHTHPATYCQAKVKLSTGWFECQIDRMNLKCKPIYFIRQYKTLNLLIIYITILPKPDKHWIIENLFAQPMVNTSQRTAALLDLYINSPISLSSTEAHLSCNVKSLFKSISQHWYSLMSYSIRTIRLKLKDAGVKRSKLYTSHSNFGILSNFVVNFCFKKRGIPPEKRTI